MTQQQANALHAMEGRQVSVALRDGTRIDDCQLVCGARSRVKSLWLFANGQDFFVPFSDVVDVWETNTDLLRAA